MIGLRSRVGLRLLIIVGSCCFLQFFIIGIINLVRGYTIQSYLPWKIFLAGYIVFGVVLPFMCIGKKSMSSCFSIMSSMGLIVVCVVSILQGRYLEDAEKYYEACQYEKTLQACDKEIHTWYHLLSYNYREQFALRLMADSYCQLADFDSARETYKLIVERYEGEFISDSAQQSLVRLEEGLSIVAYYPDRISEMPLPDRFKDDKDIGHSEVSFLFDIALEYTYNLNCHAKAFEVYTRILEMDIPESYKETARSRIEELKLADNNPGTKA